jgi:integrase
MTGSTPGIRKRHSKRCSLSLGGKRCSCTPSWEAVVGLGATGKRKRRTFPTQKQAEAWRQRESDTKSRRHRHQAPAMTLKEAAEEFLAGARTGSIVTRTHAPYRPSVLRSYDQVLKRYVFPTLGGMPLAEVSAVDLQKLVERLRGSGLSASTIRNATTPLRAIYRRAVALGLTAENPTRSVSLPSGAVRRAHAGDPGEATRLVAALPEGDQGIWGAAFWAGLRLGELRALRWSDVDEKAGLIHVCRSWDPRAGEVEPKSAAGHRSVPILAPLSPYLAAQRERCAWADRPTGLVFGSSVRTPFGYGALYRRATKAWAAANLPRVTPHQARHSFASFLIASGVTVKALTTYMGHGSSRLSLDTYGHLFPSEAVQDAAQINAWLETANTKSRLSQLETAS